eukprot:1544087-Pleurochrysis_carterae.AAC.4
MLSLRVPRPHAQAQAHRAEGRQGAQTAMPPRGSQQQRAQQQQLKSRPTHNDSQGTHMKYMYEL